MLNKNKKSETGNMPEKSENTDSNGTIMPKPGDVLVRLVVTGYLYFKGRFKVPVSVRRIGNVIEIVVKERLVKPMMVKDSSITRDQEEKFDEVVISTTPLKVVMDKFEVSIIELTDYNAAMLDGVPYEVYSGCISIEDGKKIAELEEHPMPMAA
jgi:hypothetical protein